MTISSPVNGTQRRFNELCTHGGGQGGGPARTRVQALLAESGRALTAVGHREITEHLGHYADHNPWHVCFAVGLCWGRLARLDLDFTGAAVRLIENWNDEDLRLARRFHYERGPNPIEESLRGGHILFGRVVLPSTLPEHLDRYRRAQDRWLGPIISTERPRFIGSWNATAMFMIALFSDIALAAQLTTPVVMLPPGGPIFNALSILHRTHVLSRAPSGSELDDEAFEPGAIYENNALFEEIHRGYTGWNLLDVHSGLYMLGTRLADSDNWF
jgi:hypothetical protein